MTISNDTKITASVIEPLLTLALTNKTIARMSNGENFADIEIETNDDFIDYVCSLGSLDPLSLGEDRKNGINRQVIYAERTLRRKGICRKCGRGRYALATAPTDGLTEQSTVEVVVEQPIQVETLAKVEDTATDNTTDNTLGGLLYERPASFPSVGIYSDSHFRNIAIAQSKCFGRWSGSARSACAECPLASFCFEKQNLDLEAFAVKFNERVTVDSSTTTTKPSSTATTATTTTTTKSTKSSGKASVDLSKARRIQARLEATCQHCGSKIQVGSDTVWVPGGGTYHADCVE